MTLLGLALLGALGGLLWWWLFLPRVHLFALPIVDYDLLAVPPIPFSSEDLEELTSLPFDPERLGDGLETSRGIDNLASSLAGKVTGQRDTLILYVSAHAVSDDGHAYLLCSDYRLDKQIGEGRRELRRLLEDVGSCPARLKLLILDLGHIAADPRLGMVVNEFPHLLEKEVADPSLKGRGLWVLTANRPLEVSQVSDPLKRSAFGLFVAEGLRGEADRDENGRVDLDELFSYVRNGVSRWVEQESDGRAIQTPCLFQGGEKTAAPPAGLALLPASEKRAEQSAQAEVKEEEGEEGQEAKEEKEKQEEEEKQQGEKTNGDGEPAKTPASGAEKAGDGVEPVKKEPSGQPKPAPKDRARLHARQLLDDAWTLRDRMQSRAGPTGWSPVDYAPHLWREFQELLLRYELRYRAGAAFDAGQLAVELNDNILPLSDLLEKGSIPADTSQKAVLSRLARARGAFLAEQAKAGPPRAADPLATVREAVQLKNDLLFRAVDYVRWHRCASLGATLRLSLYEPISELLSEKLPELVDRLEALEDVCASARPSETDIQAGLKEVRLKKQAAEELRDQIEKNGLEREARQLLDQVQKDPSQKGLATRIDNLLRTPLLPAPLRKQLLDALEGLPGPSLAAVVAAAGSPAEVAPWQWERLAERAQLDAQVLRSIEPAVADELDLIVSDARRLTPPRDTQEEEQLWSVYRTLGNRLARFYQQLPARIAEAVGGIGRPAPSASDPTVARLLRAVDARDAASVPEGASSIAVRPLPDLTPPEEMLEVAGPDVVEVHPDDWTPLEITLLAKGPPASDASLTLQYDPGLLVVESLAGTPPAEPDRPRPVPLQPGRQRSLRYRLQARPKVQDKTPTTLVFKLAAGPQATSRHTVDLTVYPPDEVHLVVEPLENRRITVDSVGDRLRLRPFPNRLTTYCFELKNLSGRKKNVQVELFALPASSVRKPRSRDLLWDGFGGLRSGVQSLVGPVEVPLPADDNPEPIPFKPAEGAKEKAEAAKPRRAEKPAAEKPRPLVTSGVACLIRDTKGKEWIEWVDWLPLMPRDYVEPTVSYNARQRRLGIRITPRDVDGDGLPDKDVLPPGLSDRPISILWESAPNTEMKDRDKIGAPGDEADLFAVFKSAPRDGVPVSLAVDGYPRAFLYQVRCDADYERIERERSLVNVRIVAPGAGQAFPADAESLDVKFRVDAPENAFQRPGDLVEVGIDTNGDRLLRGEDTIEFTTDRQVEIWLDDLGAKGLIRVEAEVHDFAVPLTPTVKNTAVNIIARLVLPEYTPPGGEDSVRVVLDGADPLLELEVSGRPVPQGAEVPIRAVTRDLSGVVKMEFGFDLDDSSELEEGEKPKVLQEKILPQLDAGQTLITQRWNTALPTEKLLPGRYSLIVRATDQVKRQTKQLVLVEIAPPPKPRTTSTIQGRVTIYSDPMPGVRVWIEGSDLATETDQKGRYVLPDVPHGAHKLLVRGRARGISQLFEDARQIELPAATEPAVVNFRFER